MFRGDEPLDLVAYTPTSQSISITPKDDPKKFDNLVGEWWNATTDHYSQVFRQSAYPIVVENYLTATWARRLNREMPEPKRYLFQRFGIGAPWMSQLMANEAYQTQVERDLLTETARSNDSDLLPLPAAASSLALPPSPLPPPQSTLPVNPPSLSPHTFRKNASTCGSAILRTTSGTAISCVTGRATSAIWLSSKASITTSANDSNSKSPSANRKLARVMGPTVVNDVAFIGFDAYLRDGAAMGILFQANNTAMLKQQSFRRNAKQPKQNTPTPSKKPSKLPATMSPTSTRPTAACARITHSMAIFIW